jgi:excisionase family DNA binding protein
MRAVVAATTGEPLMDWITGDEVAGLLGVRPSTVRSWRLRGGGPPLYRIGGAVRYDRGEVVEWLKTRHRGENGANHHVD